MSEMSESPDVLEPIPVRMEPVEQVAPEFGSWQTLRQPDGAAAARLLPQATKRHRAVIIVNGAGHDVMIGTREQVQNGQGGLVPAGTVLVTEAQSELWCVSAAVGLLSYTVTVLDERYR